MRALRVFRLLRVFKLAKVWKSFNYLLVTIYNTLRKIGYFSVILFLFLMSYAIVGKEFFAY